MYDLRGSPAPLGLTAITVCVVAVGVFIACLKTLKGPRRWLPLAVTLTWSTCVIAAAVVPFYRMRRDLDQGSCLVVDGVITEYNALEPRTLGSESFRVGGMWFFFSDADFAPGYKRTRRRGGKLDVGRHVRVSSIDGRIVQIEDCYP